MTTEPNGVPAGTTAIVDNAPLDWLATSVRARSACVGSGGAGLAGAEAAPGPTGSHPGMMCPLLTSSVLARRARPLLGPARRWALP